MDGMLALYIFLLAAVLGYELIAKVPVILHTPLMSGANAIHGIVLVGAIIVTGQSTHTPTTILGLIAIVMATINLVGGFVVTDRMLEMFKPKKDKPALDEGADAKGGAA